MYINNKLVYNSKMIDKDRRNLSLSSRNCGNMKEYFMTATQKLINTFKKGTSLTARQIASRFGLANPYDAIAYIRRQGYSVKATPAKLYSGSVVNKYSFK
jgi:hypothetical protein